jgi:N-acetylglutamate synthase-like GNAT family acetyltransferase
MWPDKPLDFIKLKDDSLGVHYGLYEQDELASVVSCFERGKEMQFRKLATLISKQKNGFGTFLLNYIIELAKTKAMKKVWCNARLNKKAFYEKFGFHEVGKRFEKDGTGFTIMELDL